MAQARLAMAQEQQARAQLEQARAAEQLSIARSAVAQQKAAAPSNEAAGTAIETVLRDQAEAWNAGNLDKFMEHYWQSDDLTFSSGGKTTRGWNATLNRYREKYPSPEKMGKLKFDNLEVTPLGSEAALVLGQWHVERESEPLSGNFSLVVRKRNDRWLIIHDHTSRVE
jgi:beta-aspartyl-peptidase (threonine type)